MPENIEDRQKVWKMAKFEDDDVINQVMTSSLLESNF